ncbi:PrsW family intramembrane metalloprotease [Staphylococcus simulans]|uniref:PrsW family glutamic-type intramembrane protease n=1 Tax=Staphylococcus simulans TaxID=1286 RepID=UPI001E36ACCA|nr:PrsW family glutamic-type intramembrane protease [Staphylococcus simulans]MCD8915464.1 PrsW family intramembrane metalloprotease [Staphylococcus simulans]
MKCLNCGQTINENDKFCMSCGADLELQRVERKNSITCPSCASEVDEHDKFCGKCGYDLNSENSTVHANSQSSEKSSIAHDAKTLFGTTTQSIGRLAGNEGSLDLNLKDMFSEVFKKHTKEESDEIFIGGTKNTTPDLNEISEEWGKPWLFSRVFLAFSATFAMLWIMVASFGNSLAIPGLIFIGALTVPLSCLFFFFESNAFKNISLFEVLKMFFVGGVFSLLTTSFLYGFVSLSDQYSIFGTLTIIDAFIIGVVEETGKAIIIIYFINVLNTNKILNGLLIGASIGAGFAVFESAGYILNYSFDDTSNLIDMVFLRAWTNIGTHIVWSAIIGAVVIIAKESGKFSFNNISNKSFLFFYFVSVLLHTIWDADLAFLGQGMIKVIILIAIGWLFVFILMKAGLNQINTLRKQTLSDFGGTNE